MLKFSMENANEYTADQLALVLGILGEACNLNLHLGVSADGADDYVVPAPPRNGVQRVVWIHNDNAENLGLSRTSNYLGIRSPHVEDTIVVATGKPEDIEVGRTAPPPSPAPRSQTAKPAVPEEEARSDDDVDAPVDTIESGDSCSDIADAADAADYRDAEDSDQYCPSSDWSCDESDVDGDGQTEVGQDEQSDAGGAQGADVEEHCELDVSEGANQRARHKLKEAKLQDWLGISAETMGMLMAEAGGYRPRVPTGYKPNSRFVALIEKAIVKIRGDTKHTTMSEVSRVALQSGTDEEWANAIDSHTSEEVKKFILQGVPPRAKDFTKLPNAYETDAFGVYACMLLATEQGKHHHHLYVGSATSTAIPGRNLGGIKKRVMDRDKPTLIPSYFHTFSGMGRAGNQYFAKLRSRKRASDRYQRMTSAQKEERKKRNRRPGAAPGPKMLKWTEEENKLLLQLRADQNQSWEEFHQLFSERFHGRRVWTIQSHHAKVMRALNSQRPKEQASQRRMWTAKEDTLLSNL
ncbi:hypothetical protein SAPIO_CDS4631 [Scedosporium apiospermum]|uniref:Myb-like domain-containing protein n=1 Tax=Pseudallescheria apiosperma TaxID=563466 RepID=A0A084G7Y3_PSEDA|nr:uncharacterized protein SAPIO_CDS4631 [Scedosporium apiospermum]KEZ43445.1 hypothetical protein SAPIO_CDS4631 [Scedosporium apiospermum]